jgi:hypothetical protein
LLPSGCIDPFSNALQQRLGAIADGDEALLKTSMNPKSALALSLERGNKSSSPFSLGRRVGDEGQSSVDSAMPEMITQIWQI